MTLAGCHRGGVSTRWSALARGLFGLAEVHRADREANTDDVAKFELLGRSHRTLDRHDVAPIFWKERRCPLSGANLRRDRDHSPSIGNRGGSGVQRGTLFVGDRDEMERRRTSPVPDLSGELQIHSRRLLDEHAGAEHPGDVVTVARAASKVRSQRGGERRRSSRAPRQRRGRRRCDGT